MDKRPRLVLFDEPEYAGLLTEYFHARRFNPFEVVAYTNREDLLQDAGPISILLVAEKYYNGELPNADCTVVLSESGYFDAGECLLVSKYRAADEVFRKIIGIYAELGGLVPKNEAGVNTAFIGMYSPIKRSFQTSFALAMSEVLAEKKKVLFIDMGGFSGIYEDEEMISERDIGDLLYYMDSKKEKFYIHLQSIVRQMGGVDCIPGMRNCINLNTTTPAEWIKLIEMIRQSELYDYVILDLSDRLQGLLEILSECSAVYTICEEDPYSKKKIQQYENLLQYLNRDDLLSKSIKLRVPVFKKIPENISRYQNMDLFSYVREQVNKLNV